IAADSTSSHEAPSSTDLQTKLSEATIIALSLTNTLFPLSIGPPKSCHVFPLSVDRKKPNPPTAKRELPFMANERITLCSKPVVGLQVLPLSVDLKTLTRLRQLFLTAASKLPPEAIMSFIDVRSIQFVATIQVTPLSVDL